MFKTATFFRAPNLAQPLEHPTLPRFQPCSPTQEKSMGWVPPRAEDGDLIEIVAGQTILKLVIEVKVVPADVIKRKAKEQAKKYEDETGHKPSKKMLVEIKDDIKLTLLPHAFGKRSSVLVWISPEGFVTIDTASKGKADDAITALVAAFKDLQVDYVYTRQSPSDAMSSWLLEQEAPADLAIERACELRATDDSGAVVKYSQHLLHIDQVQGHIKSGKAAVKLALTFNDRVSFTLTDTLSLLKLDFLQAGAALGSDGEADAFDADVTLLAGEMIPLYNGLLEALLGEVTA